MARRKNPIALLPREERLRALEMLGESVNGGQGGSGPVYDPTFHPASLVEYFKAAFDALEASERCQSIRSYPDGSTEERGDVRYVQRPVDPPTLAGWAASVGIHRATVHAWREEHPEFGEAHALALAMQEHVIVSLTLKGGYDSRVAGLVLKNYHGWADKVEQRNDSRITIVIDEQDEEA